MNCPNLGYACLIPSSLRLLLAQDSFARHALDLSRVDSAIRSIARCDNDVGIAVRCVPCQFPLPALSIGRHVEHPEMLPVVRVAQVGDGEIRKTKITFILARKKSRLVVVADSEARQGVGDDNFRLGSHKNTLGGTVNEVMRERNRDILATQAKFEE